MWTSTVRRAARAIISAAIGVFTLMTTAPSGAAPVQYARVCSLYGADFFYIPGTDTCTNASDIVANEFAIARAHTLASTGTAMATALVNPFLPDGTNYAISTHWAVFDGEQAVGLAGMMRLRGNLVLTGGLSLGLDRGSLTSLNDRTQTQFGTSVPSQSWSDVQVLGRVGLEYSW
jgi:hypothetical protein